MALAGRRRVALRSSGGRGPRPRRRRSWANTLGSLLGTLAIRCSTRGTQRRQRRRGILEVLFLIDGGPQLPEAPPDLHQTVQHLLQLVGVPAGADAKPFGAGHTLSLALWPCNQSENSPVEPRGERKQQDH